MNQIFIRLFKILTEEKFRIHQDECIQNWDSIQNKHIDGDEDEEVDNEEEENEEEENEEEENEEEENEEEENEVEADCSKTNRM